MVADHENDQRERRRELLLAAELQRMYADAVLDGDPQRAERVVREAIDAGLGEALIDDHVIRPSLVLVGDLWADGHITVADEHLATAISIRVLMLQREAFRVARQRASRRVLLAGAQDEHHVVGLEMAASVMVHAGYDVRFLGADVPVASLAAAVARHRPAVVGFTSATPLTALHLPAAFDAVRGVDREIGIVVGGQGPTPKMTAGWGVTVCRHVADAVDHVDALVRRAGHN